jgi:DNA-binding transcriptional MerR regulator
MLETKHKNPNLARKVNRKARRQTTTEELPIIPDKRYFTIGEVSDLCQLQPHVLRYWEQEFPQLKPAKRRGNRRFYQYEDVLVIRKIRKLLYENGFTIEGARAQLSDNSAEITKSVQKDAVMKKMIADLENILQNLKITTA